MVEGKSQVYINALSKSTQTSTSATLLKENAIHTDLSLSYEVLGKVIVTDLSEDLLIDENSEMRTQ